MSTYKDHPLSRDTTAEAEQVFFQLLAKKSPPERLQMVSEMNATVRVLAMAGLRQRHPDETDLQLKIRLAELLHGTTAAAEIAEKLKVSQRDE